MSDWDTKNIKDLEHLWGSIETGNAFQVEYVDPILLFQAIAVLSERLDALQTEIYRIEKEKYVLTLSRVSKEGSV